jgi:hypothetical protein
MTLVGVDGYGFIAGLHDAPGSVDLYKIPIGGGAITQPDAAWQNKTMGRLVGFWDEADLVYILHGGVYGSLATTEQDLFFFTIDTTDDSVSSSTALTPTKGNAISAPRHSSGVVPFTSRGDILSPYDVFAETLNLGTPPSDTDPPADVAVVSIRSVDATTLEVVFDTPDDVDFASYEIEWRNDGTDPDADPDNGDATDGPAASASPSTRLTVQVPGLDNSVFTSLRIFAVDGSGNASQGVVVRGTPLAPLEEIGWERSDGTFVGPGEQPGNPPPNAGASPRWLVQLHPSSHEEALPSNYKAVFGLDQAIPPSVGIVTLTPANTLMEYEEAPGDWTPVDPLVGVPPGHQDKPLRVYTNLSGDFTWYGVIRPEQ